MGFVIWYRVIVRNGALPLVTVSNDVFGGQYTLDADIEVPLYEGDLTAEFRIKITDLPAGVARTVKAAAESGLRSREPVTADVYLGYFDARRPAAVVHGAITSVRTNVTADKLVTELRGTDLAAWKLLQTRIDFHREGRVTPEAAVSYVLDQADVSQRGTVAIGEERTNYTLTASTGIAALGEISRWARCRFAVRDNEVAWQSTPLAPGLPAIPEIGPPLLKGENLVSFSDELSGEAARTGRDRSEDGRVPPRVFRTYDVTTLGIPDLRPGQTVPVTTGSAPRALYVQQVAHRFSTSTGYVCDLVLADDGDGPPTDLAPRGAPRIVQRLRELAGRDSRPAIDVGEVTEYLPGKDGKHLATVNYGQRPGPDVVAPSVETPIERDVQLHQRAIASPFAWHRCGLIVPAYPGQRALLAHNRSDANDAVLHGYLWSEDPAMARPENEPGDWWLCLPTEVRDGRPSGKGVNDLTDARGLRTIQARGLKITVGTDRLLDVGVRPRDPPDADTITIEHASGTAVTIRSDGAVEIRTDSKAIVMTNGRASLRLDGSRAELTNGSVTVALSGSSVAIS